MSQRIDPATSASATWLRLLSRLGILGRSGDRQREVKKWLVAARQLLALKAD